MKCRCRNDPITIEEYNLNEDAIQNFLAWVFS